MILFKKVLAFFILFLIFQSQAGAEVYQPGDALTSLPNGSGTVSFDYDVEFGSCTSAEGCDSTADSFYDVVVVKNSSHELQGIYVVGNMTNPYGGKTGTILKYNIDGKLDSSAFHDGLIEIDSGRLNAALSAGVTGGSVISLTSAVHSVNDNVLWIVGTYRTTSTATSNAILLIKYDLTTSTYTYDHSVMSSLHTVTDVKFGDVAIGTSSSCAGCLVIASNTNNSKTYLHRFKPTSRTFTSVEVKMTTSGIAYPEQKINDIEIDSGNIIITGHRIDASANQEAVLGKFTFGVSSSKNVTNIYTSSSLESFADVSFNYNSSTSYNGYYAISKNSANDDFKILYLDSTLSSSSSTISGQEISDGVQIFIEDLGKYDFDNSDDELVVTTQRPDSTSSYDYLSIENYDFVTSTPSTPDFTTYDFNADTRDGYDLGLGTFSTPSQNITTTLNAVDRAIVVGLENSENYLVTVAVGNWQIQSGSPADTKGLLAIAIDKNLPVCGNGSQESVEECDDGNASNEDECSNSCEILTLLCLDVDFDGYCAEGTVTYFVASGYIPPYYEIPLYLDGYDCDDSTNTINPAESEICDSIDNNCDGTADEGLATTTYYTDADGDGYGNPTSTMSDCSSTAPSGTVTNNTDCDDSTNQKYPTNPEFCDGIDNNCSGAVDEGLSSCTFSSVCGNSNVETGEECDDGNTTSGDACSSTCQTETLYYRDADGDSFGDLAAKTYLDPRVSSTAGYSSLSTDCDDGNATVNPGATEICDSIDNDCNGSVDDGLTFVEYYPDADGDEYGSGESYSSCTGTAVAGYVANNTDCNDATELANPASSEVCDTIDNDCDGLIDDADSSVDLTGTPSYYYDGDNDSYGAGTAKAYCTQPDYYVLVDGDCDDTTTSKNPGLTEICDGFDNDCSGTADDGIGSCTPVSICGNGSVEDVEECDDANTTSHDGCSSTCLNETLYYLDDDSDGEGTASVTAYYSSIEVVPTQYVFNNTDCDDTEALKFSTNTEDCTDTVSDNDCNDATVCAEGYLDSDGDGFGKGDLVSTFETVGYASVNGDCDDSDENINPDATEVCGDAKDNDCNSATTDVCAISETCGDSTLDADEDCDDGNTTSGDGCSAACTSEDSISETCGDSTLDANEDCDDGNTTSGDGCSASCKTESDKTPNSGGGGGCSLNQSPSSSLDGAQGIIIGMIVLGLLRQRFKVSQTA